ncbi:SulP family inorganic anion transporter [Orrella marina]|uniref:Sodium-independent anion transporter n=1 Tax=Orrella marina TaxID=2163011 RepID=A0A2R4XNW5_9BURK|nr:SulP family inorganic anion transporter [Orrella marina]AWB35496.1 sodium-independent anion transporter [Orrella marina]
MIALLEARRAGLYKASNWTRNIIAGLVVGVVALPLSMAFAIASGARPEQGLYTAIIAGLLVTLFGGSRLQIAGPTGAFIAVLAGITSQYGIEGLQIATLLAGAMLLAMGLFRMGGVIRFIPAPVIIGFTAGIGIIIFTGQWADFLGIPHPPVGQFHQKIWHVLQRVHLTHWPTLAIGVLSLVLLYVTPRIHVLKRVPGPLIVLVLATLIQSGLKFDGVATIGSAFGGIPQGLPAFGLPDLSFDKVTLLVAPAFTIAMLGAIESLLSAVVADRMTSTRHDANQELIGQGIANMVVPFFGGFAATGAIARTATNIRNGGNSPVAGVFHVLTLVGVLIALAPLAYNIPLSCLSAILFVVAWNMSEVHRIRMMLARAPVADRVILLVTLLLTVFVDLVVAVNVGVILAILHFMRRMAQTVRMQTIREEDGYRVSRVEGPLFFAAVGMIEHASRTLPKPVRVWVLDLSRVPFVDETALQALDDVIDELRERQCRLVLAEANEIVLQKLRLHGTLRTLGDGGYLSKLSSLDPKIKAAQIREVKGGPAW